MLSQKIYCHVPIPIDTIKTEQFVKVEDILNIITSSKTLQDFLCIDWITERESPFKMTLWKFLEAASEFASLHASVSPIKLLQIQPTRLPEELRAMAAMEPHFLFMSIASQKLTLIGARRWMIKRRKRSCMYYELMHSSHCSYNLRSN